MRYEDLVTGGEPTPRFGPLRPNLVLYTSGTTGAPKGVPPLDLAGADFERLARYGASVGSVPRHPAAGRVLMTLPVHHGAGAAAATGACASGGTAVLLDPYDPEEALRLIDTHKVQMWIGVPTMLLRIQALPEEVVDRYDLSSIEALTVGAAPVPQSLKQWIIDRIGSRAVGGLRHERVRDDQLHAARAPAHEAGQQRHPVRRCRGRDRRRGLEPPTGR